MSERHDVIVIGSGIGGLAAALTCARAGRSVLVLEAGKQFGGYTNPFSRKHYHFDPGIHYIGQCHPGGSFRHLLNRLGLEHVEFRELDPDGFDHYVFPDYDVKNCVGLDRFRDRLAADFPQEQKGLDRFFKILHETENALARMRRVRGLKDTVKLLGRSTGVLRWSRSTLKACLDHHFDDVRLKAALAGPCGDLGEPPSRLSALMHFGLLTHYATGAFFPAGGSGKLRDAFVDGLREEGATLRRNARVDRILVEGGRAVGVRTASGEEHRADAVISNAQVEVTYGMLEGAEAPRRVQRKVDKLESSPASIVVFMGVDGELETSHIGSTNVWSYSSTDIEACYRSSEAGEFEKNLGFFLTVPTRKDPQGELAPEGMQTVEIVALTSGTPFAKWFGDKTMKRGDEYGRLKEELGDFFVERAEKHLPGLRDHIVLREVATPATNHSYTLAPGGNIYGPAHTPAQTMPFRFKTKAPVDGLYLCGASVMGAGIVPCASSGRAAGKAVLAERKPRPMTQAAGLEPATS
ncbi:MAG: NAD(P)/FAD-dependent oxidoreductase [Myxococcota bacterium]